MKFLAAPVSGKIAPDMEIAMQQQGHAPVMKDGPESDVKYRTVLAHLTASEGVFATVQLMFQSVRTVSKAGWVQAATSLACMGCRARWTVVIVLVNQDGLV